MEYRKGVVITGKNTMAVSDHCPIPKEPARQVRLLNR